MPRRKAADRAGPVKTRTRSGCRECREARVRCDELKPVCTRCVERGLACSTQLVLKWESDFASRGLAFGRAGVWNKAGDKGSPTSSTSSQSDSHRAWCSVPTVEHWAFVNTNVRMFEEPYRVSPDADSPGASPLALALTRSPALFPQVPSLDQSMLFDYYVRQMCPETTASSKSLSPFASAILPFCLTASPTLFKAINALGACHRSRSDPDYNALSLRYKSETLRALRQKLAVAGVPACSTDPEVMAVMMMLCLYEIIDNCDEQWTVHLRGAKDLIRFRRQQQSDSNTPLDPVMAFAESFFAFQDVMGRTACGEEVVFGSDYWSTDDRNVDLWMGCSPELVSVLSSITELSRLRRKLTSDSAQAGLAFKAASLGRRLDHLVQEVGHDEDGEEDQTLATTAELKRLAAVVYLHCALYGASPSTPLVDGHVKRILRFVSAMLDLGCVASMTWPVFVAAVELNPLQDDLWSDADTGAVIHGRPLVLRALAAMAESGVCNVVRTRAVVSRVWQARDIDTLKGSPVDSSRDPTSCNDWEWYVAPVSTAMSLA